MEVILKQDMQNLGIKDEIVKVRDGYARNYLIPQGFATTATESAKKVLAENTKQRAHKEAQIKAEAQKTAEKMNGLKLQIGAKTSTTGKIFGSVNTIQVAEALKEKGYDVDRRNITLINADTIKEVGSYKAKVRLHKEVILEIDFDIISE